MSHLLNRLASRALGITPAIEPLRTPSFSNLSVDQTASGQLQPAQLLTKKMQRAGEDQASPVSSTTVQLSPASEVISAATQQITHHPAPPAAGRAFGERLPGLNGSSEAQETSAPAGRRQGLTSTAPLDTVSRSEGELRPAREGIDADQARVSAASVAEHRTALTPATSVPEWPDHDAIENGIDQGSRPAAVLQPQAAVLPVFALPVSTAQDASAAGSSPLAMTPGIQVTIGRIEVRAVTGPAPAATQRQKPAPRLSLDDYLRQRSEGGR